jgi:hypothetical protein
MVKADDSLGTTRWLPSVAFGIIAPIFLFSVFLLVSRLIVRSLYGPGDFPALFISALAGALPIARSNCSILAKIGFTLLYVITFSILLGLYGFAIDCSVFHDCD